MSFLEAPKDAAKFQLTNEETNRWTASLLSDGGFTSGSVCQNSFVHKAMEVSEITDRLLLLVCMS